MKDDMPQEVVALYAHSHYSTMAEHWEDYTQEFKQAKPVYEHPFLQPLNLDQQ